MKTLIRITVAAVVLAGFGGCSHDITKSASPVQLIASNVQTLSRLDIATGAANCDKSIGTIQIQAVIKGSSTATSTFEQVHITRYHVSYVRTDGGKQVPAPFDRSMDSLLTPGGGSTALSNFLILQAEAIQQAPFVALQPNNGGRDPDTGLSVVRMDVIVDIFGQTIAGDNLSARTQFPLEFCYNCGGCQ